MPNMLITGASGFLGSHLLKRFCDLGFDVVGGIRATSNLWRLKSYSEKVRFINLDDQSSLENFFRDTKIDIIIHAACAYGRADSSEIDVFKANVELPLKLAHLSRKCDSLLFINADTFFAKPEFELGHMGAYVLSKRHCWEWLQLFKNDLKIINMRLEHMYGPLDDRSKFISWFCEKFLKSAGQQRLVELSSCSQLRDFVYIDDVISAFERVVLNASSLHSGEIFEVGTGEAKTVRAMVEQIQKTFSHSGVDGVRPVFDMSRDRPGEIMQSSANIAPLEKLGWSPVFSLSQGVECLVEVELRGKT
jgi:CDP-paratose synthetase